MTHEELKRHIQKRMIDGAVYERGVINGSGKRIIILFDGKEFVDGVNRNLLTPVLSWRNCENWVEIESPIEGHPDNPRYKLAGIKPPVTWGELIYRRIVNKETWVYSDTNDGWWTDEIGAFRDNDMEIESVFKLGLIQPDGTVKEVER